MARALKRDGQGYILTVTSKTDAETRIRIEPNGSMRNLSGGKIGQTDVTRAVLEFRTIGASGMVENILGWWKKK